MKAVTSEEVWKALDAVKDPEIPVVSVVEMGIIRDVTLSEEQVTVKMTPTFSGCPALHVMKEDIIEQIRALGVEQVEVETVLYPPWTTDWITEEARAKLRSFGLAPPIRHNGNVPITFYEPATCPYCNSNDTSLKNSFGPTLCRAIYYCNHCQQPFEQFKAL